MGRRRADDRHHRQRDVPRRHRRSTVVDGLAARLGRTDARGIAFRTLPRPAGRLRCRFATVNDVHFGEAEAGRVGDSELGPIQRVAAGATPYPEVMNRAAVAEIGAADGAAPSPP